MFVNPDAQNKGGHADAFRCTMTQQQKEIDSLSLN